MRQFKFLVLAMSVGFVGAAHAANSGSEFWFQPKDGQSAVKLDVATSAIKIEVKNLDGSKYSDAEVATMPMILSYEYGLDDKNAMGVYLDLGSSTNKSTLVGAPTNEYKFTGMGDFHLTYKGDLDGALHYGADLTLGMTKAKDATSSKNGSRNSGGLAVEPYIGYHLGSYGIKLAYLLKMERTSTNQGTPEVESKTTGGNALTLTPYYELNYGPGAVDFYLNYVNAGDSTTTPTGGTSSSGGALTKISLGASGNYELTSAVALLYKLEYTSLSDMNVSSAFAKASGSGTYLGAGVRMTF